MRMMPTEVLAAAVTVCPDTGPESLDFVDQLLAGQRFEVIIHNPSQFSSGAPATVCRGTHRSDARLLHLDDCAHPRVEAALKAMIAGCQVVEV